MGSICICYRCLESIRMRTCASSRPWIVVRKAVRRAITSRLRRLGMGYDYDVSGSGPRMSILLLTGTFQIVKHDPKLNGESYEYANSAGGHQLPDDATEWAQSLDIHVREMT